MVLGARAAVLSAGAQRGRQAAAVGLVERRRLGPRRGRYQAVGMRHQRGQEFGVGVFVGDGFAGRGRCSAAGSLGQLGRRRSRSRHAVAPLRGRRGGGAWCWFWGSGGGRCGGRTGQVQHRQRGHGRRWRYGGHGWRSGDAWRHGRGGCAWHGGKAWRRLRRVAARLPLRHRHQGQGDQARAQAPAPSACGRPVAGTCCGPRASVERAQDADAKAAGVLAFGSRRPRCSGAQQARPCGARWRCRTLGMRGVHGHGGDSVAALSM